MPVYSCTDRLIGGLEQYVWFLSGVAVVIPDADSHILWVGMVMLM